MSKIILYTFAVIVFIIFMGFVIYALRLFTNSTTAITETKMSNGAVCYLATTADGAALSCIK